MCYVAQKPTQKAKDETLRGSKIFFILVFDGDPTTLVQVIAYCLLRDLPEIKFKGCISKIRLVKWLVSCVISDMLQNSWFLVRYVRLQTQENPYKPLLRRENKTPSILVLKYAGPQWVAPNRNVIIRAWVCRSLQTTMYPTICCDYADLSLDLTPLQTSFSRCGNCKRSKWVPAEVHRCLLTIPGFQCLAWKKSSLLMNPNFWFLTETEQ